jgi:hypothetical protein
MPCVLLISLSPSRALCGFFSSRIRVRVKGPKLATRIPEFQEILFIYLKYEVLIIQVFQELFKNNITTFNYY